MKKDKTRTPPLSIESEQLESLRTKQEWHEGLARKHAASARRVWLRRILLEVGREGPTRNKGARKKAGHQDHASE